MIDPQIQELSLPLAKRHEGAARAEKFLALRLPRRILLIDIGFKSKSERTYLLAIDQEGR